MASGSTNAKQHAAKPASLVRDLVARIRQRREAIRQTVGTLSDGAALIREDRDR